MRILWSLAAVFVFALFGVLGSVAAEPLSKRKIARVHVRVWELLSFEAPWSGKKSAAELCDKRTLPLLLDFNPDRSFSGDLCCNAMRGKYQLSSNEEISIDERIQTQSVECLSNNFLKDEEFVRYFSDISQVLLADKILQLRTPNGVVFTYRAQLINGELERR